MILNHRMFNFLIALLLLLYPSTAHAYIDPGAGSSVIQVVIASAVAGMFALKMFWQKVISKIRRK